MKEFNIGELKVKVPIIQGGMGVGISLSGLAAAVANQGGIGVISAAAIGLTEPNREKNYQKANKTALQKHIRKARLLSDGIIGVNLMVALTDYDDLLKIAVDEKVDVIFMGAGLPLKFPQEFIDKGFANIHTRFVPKVSSAKAAGLICKYWSGKFNYAPDAIVVEGPKAGGHLGFSKAELETDDITLEQLIKETVAEVAKYEKQFRKEIPVIAAGGIYTGSDAYHIMKAGAKAVKMGTRFVTTHECDADIKFKNSYLKSTKTDMKLIASPVGLPGRVIGSKFVDKINAGQTKPFTCPWKCLKSCDYKKAPYCISQVLYNSALGNLDEGFAFAGSNAYKATKIESVQEVFESVINEYHIANSKSLSTLTTRQKEKMLV